MTPDLWPKTDFLPSPFIRLADALESFKARGPAERRGPRPDRGVRGGRRGGARGPYRGGRGRGEAPSGEAQAPATEQE